MKELFEALRPNVDWSDTKTQNEFAGFCLALNRPITLPPSFNAFKRGDGFVDVVVMTNLVSELNRQGFTNVQNV